MSPISPETDFMRNLVPQLEAEGYEIFLQPRPPLLPPFFGNLRPDAIARGKGKNIVIEFVTSETGQDRKTRELAALIKQHPDWDLRVFVVTSATKGATLEKQSLENIQAASAEIRRLSEQQHFSAALLMAWGAFEAFARWFMLETFERPQTPSRIVQTLAQEGLVTPSEADRLRTLAMKRNALIHGNLETDVDKADIDFFLFVLEKVIEEGRKPENQNKAETV